VPWARVKGEVNGTTTVYVGGVYEYEGGATTKYYSGPGGTAAMRRSGYGSTNGLSYLLRDHLNSTARIVSSAGATQATTYYFPFGGKRGGSYSSITAQRYTGQYHEQDLPGSEGLYYYGARWYDASLGRFTQADPIVP